VLGGIGVDLTQWAPTPLTLKPITFIMVARLLKDKGVVEYVQAARRIKRLYPQVRFLLLGDVDTNPDSLSAATVSQWVQEQLLEWPGHVPVQPWLGQSDVFVLPSYREGVPRSTQEAMAMGRPVITTNVPGCRETVVDGDNGYLIPAQSVDALFEAMQKCVLHPEVLPLMGRRSRQMAEDKFDIQVINQKLMSLLEVAPSAAH
jgi:glycosyltransferase involved in cell wall biosynthesis